MKRWLKYVKPYKTYFILGPLCMIVEVIGEVLLPKLLSSVINSGNAGTLTIGVQRRHLPFDDPDGAAHDGGRRGRGVLRLEGVGQLRRGHARAMCTAKIQTFSFANIDHFSTGSLVTRLTNDVTQVHELRSTCCCACALRAPGMLIGALIMAIAIKPSLAVVLAVSVPLMLLSVFLITRRRASPGSRPCRRRSTALNYGSCRRT